MRVRAFDGRQEEMLAMTHKGQSNPQRQIVLHLLVIRSGRLLAGDALQPLIKTFKLSGDNRLILTGGPCPARPEQDSVKVWRDAGFSWRDIAASAAVTDYPQFKERAEAANVRCAAASKALERFPRGPMGLTPDDVKRSPEWLSARAEYDSAFSECRSLHDALRKHFPAELRADKEAARRQRLEAFHTAQGQRQ